MLSLKCSENLCRQYSKRERVTVGECPKENINQIGRWSPSDIGESYRDGFPVINLIE